MARNIMKVKETKDRYDVTYMAGDDSGFDMMEGALLVLEAMNLPINWHRADLGWCMWEKSNKKFGEGDPRCGRHPYGGHHLKGRRKGLQVRHPSDAPAL